jgi:MoxR-like ATPase
MEGTYPLPEAQLDRFFFKLVVDFPDRDSLHTILDRTTTDETPRLEPVIEKGRVLEMRELVRKVPLARVVQDYAVRVLQATHPETAEATPTSKQYLRYGASPRGLQAIILAAKIRALLEGRYAVAVDDIRAVAKPALRHRLILNFEGEAEGVEADTIIDEILKQTKEAT